MTAGRFSHPGWPSGPERPRHDGQIRPPREARRPDLAVWKRALGPAWPLRARESSCHHPRHGRHHPTCKAGVYRLQGSTTNLCCSWSVTLPDVVREQVNLISTQHQSLRSLGAYESRGSNIEASHADWVCLRASIEVRDKRNTG